MIKFVRYLALVTIATIGLSSAVSAATIRFKSATYEGPYLKGKNKQEASSWQRHFTF